jgi:hypothetical protein
VPHHSPEVCGVAGPSGATCERPPAHQGAHGGMAWVRWAETYSDDAPTLKLPPVRESVGPRRRPPEPIVRELRERTEFLAALVEELAAYDEDGEQ